jgi:ubiquinone/menaquinone biosynthesis C-methylase UbiE
MTEFRELLAAYEGLESSSSFEGDGARADYREAMIERSRPQADFIERFAAPGRVLEVGCGNGRLLVELARRGSLPTALGVDIAHSRIEFAQQWAREEGLGALEFRADDVFAVEVQDASFDTAICITGAFAYFDPVRAGAGAALLEHMRAAVKDGGLLVLELYQHPREVELVRGAGGELRLWKELPEPDPWRLYLSHFELSDDAVLTHHKTFVHRTSGAIDSGRTERLRIYEPSEIVELLEDAGFASIELWQGWSDESYAGGDVLVVSARAA